MFKGHPRSLIILALANMGERFGYYTMLSIFALYLQATFGLTPSEYKKDKSSERKTDQPRWKATDLSDAVDNLYYWMFFQSLDNSEPAHDMMFLG